MYPWLVQTSVLDSEPLAAAMEVHLSLSDCKFLKIFICKTYKELFIRLRLKGKYLIAAGSTVIS